MNHVIDQIAAYGRNGDTELVHMSKEEVAGLRALGKAYGAKMTKNPKTGLDEMFNFKSLLPTLAGAALTIGSGGALSPLAAGLIVGAGTTVATGDINQGLMAGLGGFGGAGIGSALAGAAGSTAAGAAGASGTAAGTTPAAAGAAGTGTAAGTVTTGSIDAAGATMPNVAAGPAPTVAGTTTSAPIYSADTSGAFPSNMSSMPGDMAPQVSTGVTPPPGSAAPSGGQYLDRVISGGEKLMSSDKAVQEAAQADFDKVMGERTLGKYGTYAAAAAPVLTDFGVEPLAGPEEDRERYRGEVYRDKFGVQRTRAVPMASGGEVRGYSIGGGVKKVTDNLFDHLANFIPELRQKMDMRDGTVGGNKAEVYKDDQDVTRTRIVNKMNSGGLASLGKHVKGNGDGMSDDIRASIEGREPVMLSEGEYVVPAQAVSALGSGSTDAGVKKLDAMVKRIYAAQTGKPKQMRPMNEKKVMPA